MNKELPARFWAKVRKTESCWIWTAFSYKGYGRWAWRNKKSPGTWNYAHQWSFWERHGFVPSGDNTVDHKCGNSLCVNPDHLRVLSKADNARIAYGAVQLAKTHCPKGHEYTPENTTYNRPKTKTGRVCRKCDNARPPRPRKKPTSAPAAQAVSRGHVTSERYRRGKPRAQQPQTR